jgi:hypothetical protein
LFGSHRTRANLPGLARRVCRTPEEGDGDLDTLAVEASSYVADYVAAKADGVVTHIEEARLREDRRRVRSAAA